MSETGGEVTTAELARRFDRVEGKLDKFYAEAVLRAEFEARWSAHDREIRDLKEAQKSAAQALHLEETSNRVPWPLVVTAIVAVAAVLISVIPLIANG